MFACLLVSALAVAPAARPVFSLSVLPAVIELQAVPGSSASETVHFINRGTRSIVVGPEVWDWVPTPQGQYLTVAPGTLANTVLPWFTVQPQSALIPPNTEAKFKVTVSLPTTARGGVYAMVYLNGRQQLDPKLGDSGLAVGAEIAVRVLVDTGTAQPSLKARIVSISPATATDKLRIKIELKNDGPTHLLAEPNIDIMGPLDDFVAYLAPDRETVLLLPGESTTVGFEWAGNLAPARYSVIASAYYGKQRAATDEGELIVNEPAPVVAPKVKATARVLPTAKGTSPPMAKPEQMAAPDETMSAKDVATQGKQTTAVRTDNKKAVKPRRIDKTKAAKKGKLRRQQ